MNLINIILRVFNISNKNDNNDTVYRIDVRRDK